MKKRSLVLILLAVLLLVVVGAAILIAISFSKGKVPEKTIIEVDLETQVLEYVPPDPFAQLSLKDTPTVRGLVETLTKAASDDNVAGLIARVGQGGMGFAQLQEVRDAIIAFREAGKPAYAFSETFGEVNTGNASYYLATAFDKIYLQQSGDVNVTGLMAEAPFVRGMLGKMGLEPRMDHRHEYKNAKNMFTETEFTEAHKEATGSLITSIYDGMISGMAEGRGMGEDKLRALVASGPHYGQEAVDNDLVDGLAYRDEVYDEIKEAVGEGAELLYLGAYAKRAGRAWGEGDDIALIYGVGGIARGKSEFNALTGGATMGSDTVAAAFRAAVRDDDVKAILFRIDCNGGSYVASDTVLREAQRAQEAGKPVIVSMGNVAASGGYFVALSADKIVAQPGTITASIGVLGGKFLTNEMWDKVGISWDNVKTSDNSSMWTGTHDYSPEQWERYSAWLDRVYEDFTSKVAEGRGMELEQLREIAKGRVWTGAQAKELGLVDELGGFKVALDLAREAAGLDADADVHLRTFPKQKSPFEELMSQGGPQNSEKIAVMAVAQVFETLRPVAIMAERLGLIEGAPQTLALPPEMVIRP
ncbi:MAG: signal peptide peptidase SppA [bacterium]|nr:signal peptide peptidase SppA [bacterium]